MVIEDNVKHDGGLVRLKCRVQNYDWGRIGHESLVARMFSRNCNGQIDESKHYAEFWMGTHDTGPSFLVEEGIGNVSLKSWISENPEVLGDSVVEMWGVDLPFMFKVLSVARALSIQAHPDKELAGFLHMLKPDVYKDSNHKPEMALALTEFEALCGFISFEELEAVLESVPEIKEVVDGACADQEDFPVDKLDREAKEMQFLQSIFVKLMSAGRDVISASVSNLISRLNMENKIRPLTSKEELALKLEKQYPGDIGVITSFLFNHVKLNPGEALCLGSNEPHAYVGGECVECMATSDNVVRAGLTPKNRDVKILCSMLTYKQGSPEILKGVPVNAYTRRYTPPFDEFEVDQCKLDQGASVTFPSVPGPSIFLVLSGHGSMHASSSLTHGTVSEGDVLFAPANTEVHVATLSELLLYRAGVNSQALT